MIFSILYRTTIGFLLAFSNEDDLSTLFALGASLFYLVFNLINLPFRKAYHNYRACLCHVTHFITLFVAMYYRSMKSSAGVGEVSRIFSPAKVEFGLILSSIVVSSAVLTYDTYLFVKKLIKPPLQPPKEPAPLQ